MIHDKDLNSLISRKWPDWKKLEEEERKKKKEDLFKVPGWKKRDFDAMVFDDTICERKGYGHIDYGHSSGGYGGYGYVDLKKRQCYFHSTYSESKAVHKKYLNWYMKQENKELYDELRPSDVFGTDDEEYEANLTGRHFKFVISPEDGNKMSEEDFRTLAKSFINNVNKITGYSLVWKGVVHNDTEHRHMHLCINGKDANGEIVYFQKSFIKNTFRGFLSRSLTYMLGERRQDEIETSTDRIIQSRRYIQLDGKIAERLQNYELFLPFIDTFDAVDKDELRLRRRVEFLCAEQLCEKTGEGKYRFVPEWEELLMNTGRYNTFLDEYLKPNPITLRMYKGGDLSGTVEKVITFDRDESYNNAYIINTGTERYYVPVHDFMHDLTKAEGKKIYIRKSGKNNDKYKTISDGDFTIR